MGVIVDSSVFIHGERQGQNVRQILASIFSTASAGLEVGMSVITLMELAHGVYRADSPQRRDRRAQFVDELRNAVPIYPITEQIAILAAHIDVTTKAEGKPIALPDLLIGTTALERGDAVLTANARHFAMIPGLRAGIIEWHPPTH
jgi:predicted nucleic acid-binding protein